MPLKTYDESITVLRKSLESAKLGNSEKTDGFRRLEAFTRTVEARFAPRADFEAAVAYEKSISPELDGRSVFDDKKKNTSRKKSPQMSMF